MNNILLLSLLILLSSCLDETFLTTGRRVRVNIHESTFPSISNVDQEFQIVLKASATNGCYSDLQLDMYETGNQHFLITASGHLQSNRFCPAKMVYKDTVINFMPTTEGEYVFKVNEAPFEIREYSVEAK